MIQYTEKNEKIMAKLVDGKKVYMGIGSTQEEAYKNLVKELNANKFAAYDFSLPTSDHNSSVRTRV